MAKSKSFFDPVDPKVNFPEEEKKLIDYWYSKKIVRKYLDRNKNSKKYFSFLDGPITANGPMGVHHAWGRTYKDLWQRYKNMQGFRERFQNGFDAQGLWVEVEVEKELGFKNKKDIEAYGIAKFVELCRDRVKKFSQIQTDQSKRLGYFMDWENSYYTLSEDNNYMIWHFLKVCDTNGWLYKGNDSVPWCPRCETAISQHEMLTEDYKEVTHETVYLSFPIAGRSNEYFLVWTTTPWTVPANIAIAVDEKLEYSKVEVDGNIYWIAKDAVERVFKGMKYKVLKNALGSRLVGWKYAGAFDDLPKVKSIAKKYSDKFHHIVPTDNLLMPIVTTEGTGLVHTAVSAGTEDFKLGKKLGLPMIPVIEDNASYMPDLGFLTGQNAKKNPKVILDYLVKLKAEGKTFHFKIENYKHRYPACWRCKTELVWKVTDEWYISMDKPAKRVVTKDLESNMSDGGVMPDDVRTLRERMVEVAKKINWIPGFGLDRELDWLNNMHDWLISKKNRYWGLALPIWECKKCGRFEVFGSKNDLKDRVSEGWKEFEGKTPHKPQIDKLKIKCANCGSLAERIEPVGNPWLDAGIVPFSTISDDNKASNFADTKTKPLYLTDKKAWRKWFPVDFITESFPGQFKNWFYSMIAMSTVLADENPFKTVLGYATCVGEDGRPMHKSWGNSIEFNTAADEIGVDVMRWMYVRQNPAVKLPFGYNVANETRRRFHLKIWNIYNFFVTYANLDEWKPRKETISKKLDAKNVLDKWILVRLNQTMEKVNQSLESYDAYLASTEVEKFVDDLSLWYVRRSRDRVGPASASEKDRNYFYETSYAILVTLSKVLAPFTPFLSEIVYRNLTKSDSIHLQDWPVIKWKLKDEDFKLIDEMSIVRQIVEKAHSLRKESNMPVRQPLSTLFTALKEPLKGLEEIIKDELNVKSVEWGSIKSEEQLDVRLDLKITPELEEEAKVRDLVRKIQEERKKMGLDLTQKVIVTSDWLPSNTSLTQWLLKKAQVSQFMQGTFKVSISSK